MSRRVQRGEVSAGALNQFSAHSLQDQQNLHKPVEEKKPRAK